MMNRRKFLRNSALIAAGIVAADQLEILDRLTWKRKFFPGANFDKKFGIRAGENLDAGDLVYQNENGIWKIDNNIYSNVRVQVIGKDGDSYIAMFKTNYNDWRGIASE